MKIEINADKNEILGGGEWAPYLELSLSEDGEATLSTGQRHSSENMTPMDVWHMRTLTWRTRLSQGCRALADLDAIGNIAERVGALLDRVHAGHTVEWDGSNMRGALDDDACEATDEIEAIIQDASWTNQTRQVWDAQEWLSALGMLAAGREYGVGLEPDATADAAIAAELESNAAADDVVLTDSGDAIDAMREALREAAIDDEGCYVVARRGHLTMVSGDQVGEWPLLQVIRSDADDGDWKLQRMGSGEVLLSGPSAWIDETEEHYGYWARPNATDIRAAMEAARPAERHDWEQDLRPLAECLKAWHGRDGWTRQRGADELRESKSTYDGWCAGRAAENESSVRRRMTLIDGAEGLTLLPRRGTS